MICDNDAMWPIDQGFIDIIVELPKRLSLGNSTHYSYFYFNNNSTGYKTRPSCDVFNR